jgi:hypothetical protein
VLVDPTHTHLRACRRRRRRRGSCACRRRCPARGSGGRTCRLRAMRCDVSQTRIRKHRHTSASKLSHVLTAGRSCCTRRSEPLAEDDKCGRFLQNEVISGQGARSNEWTIAPQYLSVNCLPVDTTSCDRGLVQNPVSAAETGELNNTSRRSESWRTASGLCCALGVSRNDARIGHRYEPQRRQDDRKQDRVRDKDPAADRVQEVSSTAKNSK